MRLQRFFTVGLLALSFTATSAFADSADKAKKQSEIRGKVTTTLQAFYKADPKLKAEVEKAAGYAVFGTYGLSFLVGGAGGTGLVHDNKTKKETFMSMAQASAGLQIGASETSYLFVFNDAASMQKFIDSGWEAGASASAGAGAGDKSVEAGAGAGTFTGGKVYTLTKTGLQVGGAIAGTKFWKDKDLNQANRQRSVPRPYPLSGYEVDPYANTIEVTGPRGYNRRLKVQDPQAVAFVRGLKTGDEVEVTFSEALATSVEPAK